MPTLLNRCFICHAPGQLFIEVRGGEREAVCDNCMKDGVERLRVRARFKKLEAQYKRRTKGMDEAAADKFTAVSLMQDLAIEQGRNEDG